MFNAFTGSISGRVQGVGFRFFAKNKADELNLSGWVRNLADGRVEVSAYGSQDLLEQFMHYLKTGPIGSRVDSVQVQWFQESPEIQGFEIRC